jgi:ubiquinone/menaquinone biosynthesis C-methylase UbiE
MQPARAIEFLKESCRVLKPGSRLIIITPNSKDLRTTERFWLDVSHVRPYPEKLLVPLLEREGFTVLAVAEDREPTNNFFERVAKAIVRIWFMGYMFRGDLVVIAETRPAVRA